MTAKLHILWYLLRVRLTLIGSRKQKKNILAIVEASIRAYASEQPNVDYRTLAERFGAPQKIAESCVAEMEPEELLKQLQIRGRILHAALAAIAVTMTVWLTIFVIAYFRYEKNLQGYAVVEIIEVEHIVHEDGSDMG